MNDISLIAVLDNQNGIGRDNGLLCHLPADLRYFKAQTLGKPVIMGRKTYESIGKPLPQRRNIVLSRTLTEDDAIGMGVEVVGSPEAAIALLEKMPEVMVIGGAHVYEAFMPYATQLYLTQIDHHFIADTYFPSISSDDWVCVERIENIADEANPYVFAFCRYRRVTCK